MSKERAEQLLKTISDAVSGVATASNFKDSRIYINPNCASRSYRGESTHQLYVDVATGKLVNQLGKGTCRSEFNAAVRDIVARVSEI